MKVIILAAGQGTRLMPYTAERPKCMVEFNSKPIINYIIDSINTVGIENIIIVSGYKSEVLKKHLIKHNNIRYYTNNNFATTNMVYSLFVAENELTSNEDVIISYSDIIYKSEVLQKLINCDSPISVVVDKDWKKLWRIRMGNPLDDAETLKIDSSGKIIEIGKKAKSYNEIEGQYIGLIKLKSSFLKEIRSFYHSLDKNTLYDGKTFNNMFMTSFLQHISAQIPLIPCYINGGWLEIDSVEDLHRYKIHAISTLNN
jgi:L-glutamine-phosphate cytidylyltransferase